MNGQGKTSANGQGETSANDQGETSANDAGEPSAKRRKPHDRQWDDYCMAVALLTRERSKDPRTQVHYVIDITTALCFLYLVQF